jgi:Na+-driven multidrug efflux pump
LNLFGAAAEVFPYARQYAGITLAGMPFLIVTNGMSNLIRADGSPRYSMTCMLAGAIVHTILVVHTILDSIFIFAFHWGIFGAALATVLGQVFSFILAVCYLWGYFAGSGNQSAEEYSKLAFGSVC